MLQNKGVVFYDTGLYSLKEERQDTWQDIKDFIRARDNESSNEVFDNGLYGQHKIYFNKGGERQVENFSEVMTAITSAVAGVYCAVKTIIAFIKNLKAKS